MRAFGWLIIIVTGIFLLVMMNSFFVVRQDEQALMLQVGEPKQVYNAPGQDQAGLYFKIPLFQQVEKLDKKNIGLDIENIEVLASDQRRLSVDAFVRWRIKDPLKFYQRFRTETAAASSTRLPIRRFAKPLATCPCRKSFPDSAHS